MPTDSEPEIQPKKANPGDNPTDNPTDSATDDAKSKVSKSGLITKFGIGLILLSGVFFFSMLSVPWWPLSGAARAVIGGVLFVGVQVAWWVGAAMAGQAVVRSMFSWFRRK